MKVAKHKVVSIDYKLTDDDGETIDSSEGMDPLTYLHGEGNIIPGLENALDDKSVGEQLNVSVSPADGYGERDDKLVHAVPREQFGDESDIEVGMRFRVPTENDEELVVAVVDVKDDAITVDGNHDLAGMTLHFDVTVREIRDATEEEIAHGHAHVGGDHD